MGTVSYMSPEQAQGNVREIDHRSDIFSFGCILYEAATGLRPFEGKDVLDTLHKIVYAPTPQIRDTNAAAPDGLQRIVRRCLSKEPEKRYQSVKDLGIELEELQQELQGATELGQTVSPAGNRHGGNRGRAPDIKCRICRQRSQESQARGAGWTTAVSRISGGELVLLQHSKL